MLNNRHIMEIEVTWLLEEGSETELALDQLIIIQGKKEKKVGELA